MFIYYYIYNAILLFIRKNIETGKCGCIQQKTKNALILYTFWVSIIKVSNIQKNFSNRSCLTNLTVVISEMFVKGAAGGGQLEIIACKIEVFRIFEKLCPRYHLNKAVFENHPKQLFVEICVFYHHLRVVFYTSSLVKTPFLVFPAFCKGLQRICTLLLYLADMTRRI